MKWQPIETAPKDGTYILACVAGYIPEVAHWQDDRKVFDFLSASDMPNDQAWIDYLDSGAKWVPTHWMPLPDPPTA